MIFQRQKLLLELVRSLEGDIGNLDFQKLLCLFCMDWEDEPTYEFVPYRFGGFSFSSYADKRKLTEKGLLEECERSWKLTEKARSKSFLPSDRKRHIDQFVDAHRELRGDELVTKVYCRFPYLATRSEMVDRLLAGDSKALEAVQSEIPEKPVPGVCTIGYEGKSLENYMNRLLKDGVNLLCDVRRNPLSRKYGFSKGALSRTCEMVGIRYEHLPELGIASEDRQELNSDDDYKVLFARYIRESLPKHGAALITIRSWVDEGYRVALTCYEHTPEQCHRHCVADALKKRFGSSCIPSHL